ncbi:histidinol-phosphate transaminase [Planomicrobium sp. CPCC 101110]|uniref:pyridoxal phosphate-dependent aminotransferase n=1 Tax=Planomicrobium sp. CPCC 101110 TaxID=2599619 RepID=UPI0011B5FD91|nr:threonine-phosphate decarboxylase [Planomicrobium sp. CPCC 101110]TWT27617.1 pyridoxal phosphate-dependent class II aminotransferase [Planomicrobium sp. CPCC 101110]
MNLPDHGANPLLLYKQMGMEPPARIIDFSENVHPFGPPVFLKEIWPDLQELVSRYPDPEAEPFRSAAAKYHGVSLHQIGVGNGAAEIFTWLARRYRKKRVALIEPAFSEYRKTLEAENVEIAAVELKEETAWKLDIAKTKRVIKGCAALYVCNPHNPTGRLVPKSDLLDLAEACRQAGCELVADEAFVDFTGEQNSLVPELNAHPNLIIVRSMTKMYAIPGLRLGYAMGAPSIIEALKSGAAHWNVNALSALIGARCFEETGYREKIIQAAREERQLMKGFFHEKGCMATDSEVNFLSFQLPDPQRSGQFFSDMLKAGIVLRHTNSFHGMDGRWFRIGMKSTGHMKELREAIAKWLEDN